MIPGEILKFTTIHFHRLSNQFPTDPRNDLFAPGMEQTGKAYASGGGGSAQLGISFKQNRLGAETPGLYRSHMSGGSAPYNQHVDVEHRLIFVN